LVISVVPLVPVLLVRGAVEGRGRGPEGGFLHREDLAHALDGGDEWGAGGDVYCLRNSLGVDGGNGGVEEWAFLEGVGCGLVPVSS